MTEHQEMVARIITGKTLPWPIMATMRGTVMRQFFFILNFYSPAKTFISKNILSTTIRVQALILWWKIWTKTRTLDIVIANKKWSPFEKLKWGINQLQSSQEMTVSLSIAKYHPLTSLQHNCKRFWTGYPMIIYSVFLNPKINTSQFIFILLAGFEPIKPSRNKLSPKSQESGGIWNLWAPSILKLLKSNCPEDSATIIKIPNTITVIGLLIKTKLKLTPILSLRSQNNW